jgi:hypothetical protein
MNLSSEVFWKRATKSCLKDKCKLSENNDPVLNHLVAKNKDLDFFRKKRNSSQSYWTNLINYNNNKSSSDCSAIVSDESQIISEEALPSFWR